MSTNPEGHVRIESQNLTLARQYYKDIVSKNKELYLKWVVIWRDQLVAVENSQHNAIDKAFAYVKTLGPNAGKEISSMIIEKVGSQRRVIEMGGGF